MDHAGSLASLTIAAQQIFDGAGMCGPGRARIPQGRIATITYAAAGAAEARDSIRLPEDVILTPGFIDFQVNGGGGVLLNAQPTETGVRRIVEAHRKYGTTGCLPTLIPDRSEVIGRLAAAAQGCLK